MVDKRVKYILYFLMIVSLFLSIKNKVNALEFERTALSISNTNIWSLDYSNTNIYTNTDDGINHNLTLELGNTNLKDTDYLYLTAWTRLVNTSYTTNSSNSINWALTCSNVTFNYDIPDYYIYYQDGTTSEIMGDLKKYWCNQYDLTGNENITSLSQIIDLYPHLSLKTINNDGLSVPCYQEGEVYRCPIKSGSSIRKIFFNVTNSGGGATYRVYIQSQVILSNDSSTAIIQSQTQINNSIQDTNNTLKDSSTDNNNMNNTFDSLNNQNASNNTISSLLLMPITLLQKILNAFNGSCSAINTGQILGTDFILPCINISDIIGATLWNIIDVICSGFLAFKIGKRFVIIFNQFTNLKEGGLESAYD